MCTQATSFAVVMTTILLSGCYADFAGIDDPGVAPDASVPDGNLVDAGPCDCPDDGNPCTDEHCDASGACVSSTNSASCDDGIYCNGADTCANGSCTIHSGDPCAGDTMCDDTAQACLGCVRDGDCPRDQHGEWSTCQYATLCDQDGAKQRLVTTYMCVSGMCLPTLLNESQNCPRNTNGNVCGNTTCGETGECQYEDMCAEEGFKETSCTARRCDAGTCTDVDFVETDDCSRDVSDPACQEPEAENCEGSDASTLDMDKRELELITKINNKRNRNGLGPLSACTTLSGTAQQHAAWMRDNDRYEHADYAAAMCGAGYQAACEQPASVSEVLADARDTGGVLHGLSAEEEGLVLGSDYAAVGVGYVCDAGDRARDRLWTIHFGPTADDCD